MKNYHKHLNLDERHNIEQLLKQHYSFKAIADFLGKDPTTISKEVRKNISILKSGSFGRTHNACLHNQSCNAFKLCKHLDCKRQYCRMCKHCNDVCPDFIEIHCPKLEKPPYVCNGCESKPKCNLRKRYYDGTKAHMSYLERLRESRSGVSISVEEAQALNKLLKPLIENGHSLHHIVSNNPDCFNVSLRTLYSYIELRALDDIKNIDLLRKVKYKPRKKASEHKVDRKCRIDRTYEDYKVFLKNNPDCHVVQIDSVEGVKGGKVILTIFFPSCGLQLAFLRESNTSASVTAVFQSLYDILGKEVYASLFQVILADNGSEFSNPSALENMGGTPVSRVFYTDPSSPDQKGACEKNHVEIRRVLPKGTSFNNLTQDTLDIVMSNVNCYTRKKLNNKSPHQSFSFLYGRDILPKLGLHYIDPNEVILTPKLLKLL